VDPDMHYWEGIIGCGLEDYPIASLADFLDPPPTMAQVMDAVSAAFGKVFGFKMINTKMDPLSELE
jgi:lipoate-protein ligase B